MSFWWVSLAHDATKPGEVGEHVGCAIIEADDSETAALGAGNLAIKNGHTDFRCHALCIKMPVSDAAAYQMALFGVGVWHSHDEVAALYDSVKAITVLKGG